MRRRIIAASFILMAASGLVWTSFAVLLVAIEADTGWSRASISFAFSLFALLNAVTAPVVGWAVGRFDSRLILAGLAAVLAAGLAMTSQATTVVQYWLAFGLIGGLGAHCFSSFAVFTVLGSRLKSRTASAMAYADAGSGLVTFVGLPVVQWVIGAFGWRAAYLALALVVGVVGAGVHLFALPQIRGRARSAAENAPGHGGGRPWLPLALMAVSFAAGAAAFQAVQTQHVAIMEEGGLSVERAVWVASAAGLSVFLWRLASGWLCDRLGERRTMVIAGLAAGAALGALISFSILGQPALLLVYAAAVGVGFGGQAMLLAMSTRNMMPPPAFASAFGSLRLAGGLGMFFGPVAVAWIAEARGDYLAALAGVAVITCLHFAAFGLATSGTKSHL